MNATKQRNQLEYWYNNVINDIPIAYPFTFLLRFFYLINGKTKKT